MYDVSGTPHLEKILAGPDRTICSVTWNPHDANQLAVVVAEEEHNILLWDLAAEAELKRLRTGAAGGQSAGLAHHIKWNPHVATELVTCSQRGVLCVNNHASEESREVEWQVKAHKYI